MAKIYSQTDDDKKNELNEIKLDAIREIMTIKLTVINNLDPKQYIENLDKVRSLEEEYIKMVYNYIDIKEKMLLNKDKI